MAVLMVGQLAALKVALKVAPRECQLDETRVGTKGGMKADYSVANSGVVLAAL